MNKLLLNTPNNVNWLDSAFATGENPLLSVPPTRTGSTKPWPAPTLAEVLTKLPDVLDPKYQDASVMMGSYSPVMFASHKLNVVVLKAVNITWPDKPG